MIQKHKNFLVLVALKLTLLWKVFLHPNGLSPDGPWVSLPFSSQLDIYVTVTFWHKWHHTLRLRKLSADLCIAAPLQQGSTYLPLGGGCSGCWGSQRRQSAVGAANKARHYTKKQNKSESEGWFCIWDNSTAQQSKSAEAPRENKVKCTTPSQQTCKSMTVQDRVAQLAPWPRRPFSG